MKSELIKKKIIDLLKKKGPFLKKKGDINKYNYLKSGHIDSLNLMKFIFQIEDKFNIKFTYKEIMSSKFGLISGLVTIIKKKIK